MDFKFVTADHHFGHKNIIKYCHRPFFTVEDMDSELISRWNSVIEPDDNVLYLGDFTLKGPTVAQGYFEQLNGNITALIGNHDHNWSRRTMYTKNGNEVVIEKDDIYVYSESGVTFYLSHYRFDEIQRFCNPVYNIHAHSHGNYNYYPNLYFTDVGVDCSNFYPTPIRKVIENHLEYRKASAYST